MFPLLSIELCEKFDPTYLKHIQKLEEDLKAVEVAYNKKKDAGFASGGWESYMQKILLEFAENYMMPKELWDMYFRGQPTDNHEPFKRLMNLTCYHFYCYDERKLWYAARKHRIYSKLLYRKIMDKPEPPNYGDYNIEDFCYPHFEMDKRMKKFEPKSCSIMPTKVIKQHEAMKKLYFKIKAVEEDDEKWIAAMLESGDIEFVEHNIEYRIGKDLTNKNLWKLYIEFLKEHDRKTLLQTYSKYIRFFMDDADMKAEYQEALEARIWKKPVEVLWKNANCKEKFVEIIKNPNRLLVTRKRKLQKYKKNSYSSNNPKPQKFPFRPNLIDYILINAPAYTLRNLFISCKWFYIRNPATLCYRFRYMKYSVGKRLWSIKEDQITFDDCPVSIKDIYITNFLEIREITPINITQFVERIYRCEIRQLEIKDQTLSIEELTSLIKFGNVEKIELRYVKTSDAENLVLEDILKYTPKIEELSIHPIRTSPNTAQIISKLPFHQKIVRFSVEIGVLEPYAFAEFINKNMAPKSSLSLSFFYGIPKTEFRKIVKEMVKSFWKENERPCLWVDEKMNMYSYEKISFF